MEGGVSGSSESLVSSSAALLRAKTNMREMMSSGRLCTLSPCLGARVLNNVLTWPAERSTSFSRSLSVVLVCCRHERADRRDSMALILSSSGETFRPDSLMKSCADLKLNYQVKVSFGRGQQDSQLFRPRTYERLPSRLCIRLFQVFA